MRRRRRRRNRERSRERNRSAVERGTTREKNGMESKSAYTFDYSLQKDASNGIEIERERVMYREIWKERDDNSSTRL